MSEEGYEVVLSGGGPFGFRLQGGKEFGRGLAIQSVSFIENLIYCEISR